MNLWQLLFCKFGRPNKSILSNTKSNEQLYRVAVTMLPNIGSVLAKNLIAYCGSAEAIFKTSKGKLEKIPQIGAERASSIAGADVLKEAEKELKFIEDYKIKTLFFADKDYPRRLKDCTDSPVMLYYMGNADLNAEKIVAIVGTRRATDYGKEMTEKLMEELAPHGVLVISGLAYGIDVAAHQSALENNLKTVGVLAHGLNTIYPQQHKGIARRMVEQGGLLTEYTSADEMHPANFPNRNRIVAGMSDAVVVMESKIKGGAVITANIANSYNRDVLTYPGRTVDKMSAGCNFLIKSYKANLIENGEDLLTFMQWNSDASKKNSRKQPQLALNLSADEQKVYALLNTGELEIDRLADESGISPSVLAATLLEMEMNNLMVSLAQEKV